MDGMYLDTFEIHDDEIDVEEIMRKIKDNIRMRKQKSGSSEGGSNEVCQQSDSAPCNAIPVNAKDIQKEFDQINSNWDIGNRTYAISSHRPILGRVLVKGRQTIKGEVGRYVDPMIDKQTEFNRSVVNILSEAYRSIGELNISKENAKDVKPILAAFENQIDQKLKELLGQIKAFVNAMNEEVENRAWLAGLLEKRINSSRAKLETSSGALDEGQGVNYFVFEERFRGSRADIKQRQAAFLQFFERCHAVLDIGSGRGEFLELMQEHGIGARGVDVDEDMVSYCRAKGLQVENIDAISYLERIEDKSVDGIFIDQVVEHLEPDYLIKMLSLCYQKLIYGGYILAETVNPLSFFSSVNFYIDMSHKKPIHPETLKFLLESAGFREIETRFFSPVPDDMRLRKIRAEDAGEEDRGLVEVYNHNIDMLNAILYGAQDYAAIGKK